MNPILRALLCVAFFALSPSFSGCASPKAAKQFPVRQHFVPAPKSSTNNGASFSALVPVPDGSGISRLIAHAGLGDDFPVREPNGTCLFEVRVVDGNDDHLSIDIVYIEPTQHLTVKRDQSVKFQIGATTFDLSYPSLTVAATPNEHPTSDQVMLLIHRLP